MHTLIKKAARVIAELSEEELKKVLMHDAKHKCELCIKFDNYMKIRELLVFWEDFKLAHIS